MIKNTNKNETIAICGYAVVSMSLYSADNPFKVFQSITPFVDACRKIQVMRLVTLLRANKHKLFSRRKPSSATQPIPFRPFFQAANMSAL